MATEENHPEQSFSNHQGEERQSRPDRYMKTGFEEQELDTQLYTYSEPSDNTAAIPVQPTTLTCRETNPDSIETTVVLPQSRWIKLKEASAAKGIAYKTICNRPDLQPRGGKADGLIGGRKAWKRETILTWLELSDSDIEKCSTKIKRRRA